MRGWPASGVLAPLGWWFTSIRSRSTVQSSAARDPLRAGASAMGLRLFCAGGVGVGRRNGRSHCRVRTPSRKIRARFREHKHRFLIFVVGEFCEVPRSTVFGSSLVGTKKIQRRKKVGFGGAQVLDEVYGATVTQEAAMKIRWEPREGEIHLPISRRVASIGKSWSW
jgi:hypothetical protein